MLPPNTKQKYLTRLKELIKKGEDVPVRTESRVTGPGYFSGKTTTKQFNKVDWPDFVEWRTNCVTLLDQIIPQNSAHRETVESFKTLSNKTSQLAFGISFLKSIQYDFENGFLDSLALEIEAELSADYMSQASTLLHEGSSGIFDHVPAAVLLGAVLEKSLKTICGQQIPSEPTVNDKGKQLQLNALIDSLKRRKVFNEIVAKQLRTWAGIRNSAAHGDFDQFDKNQVEAMATGIETFLMQYLP